MWNRIVGKIDHPLWRGFCMIGLVAYLFLVPVLMAHYFSAPIDICLLGWLLPVQLFLWVFYRIAVGIAEWIRYGAA